MVIEINKDIERYQESVAMGLSAKQLIYSISSVVVGGALVLLLFRFVGLTLAAYISIPVVAPIAMSGFYSYHGMSFNEVMKRKLLFLFANKPLVYESSECEQIVRQHIEEQEREGGTNEVKTIYRRIQGIKKGKRATIQDTEVSATDHRD